MKPIDELRELLCTVPEINEESMELRFGCILFWEWENIVYLEPWAPTMWWWSNSVRAIRGSRIQTFGNDTYKTLWNPIQERHLRMYCDKRSPHISIFSDGEIWRVTWRSYDDELICKLNNTKDFHNQSDETIKQILTFLKG